ncbi:MAG: ribonuclease P protein component [Candidatus Zixiibacteriota bacterium]|nr:MAG: ribonuclease P protein component [candidate division Zixibacteria bacterium]
MPRRFSLKSKVEIDQLLKTGKKLSGDYFSLIFEPSEDFRYGIFISRGLGGAIRRNRVKRVFREAVRKNRDLLKSNVKMVILPRSGVTDPEFETIDAEIKRIFRLVDVRT